MLRQVQCSPGKLILDGGRIQIAGLCQTSQHVTPAKQPVLRSNRDGARPRVAIPGDHDPLILSDHLRRGEREHTEDSAEMQ